jgi:uncharacterized membrane protein YbhN (UPF0104 family)
VRATGEWLPALPGARGYYISHLGKYAPGKGVALVMRTAAAVEAGVRPGVAVLTGFYETLTTMAAGALVGAALLVGAGGHDRGTLWRLLGLLALVGVPILPGVFNRVVERLSARVARDGPAPPRLGFQTLLLGLALTACGWFLLGASLEAVLHSLDLRPEPWSLSSWLRSTAFVALAWVPGFIASTPGGLGVREFVLQQFLAPELGARAVVVVLLLRLLWTLAELVLAAVLWWLPKTSTRDQVQRTKEE